MTQKDTLIELIHKIEIKYNLLEKTTLSPQFFLVYSEYCNLAHKINNIFPIKDFNQEKDKSAFFKVDENNFWIILNLKIIPMLLEFNKNKNVYLVKTPKDWEVLFYNLQYSFSKLSKMEGDIRFDYWFSEAEKYFNDFLSKIKLTEKGSLLLEGTDFKVIFSDLKESLINSDFKKNINKSTLSFLCDNDIVYQSKQFKPVMEKLGKFNLIKTNEDMLADLYKSNEKTKEELMNPVHLVQSKVIDLKSNQKNIEDVIELNYSINKSNLSLCRGDIKILFRGERKKFLEHIIDGKYKQFKIKKTPQEISKMKKAINQRFNKEFDFSMDLISVNNGYNISEKFKLNKKD